MVDTNSHTAPEPVDPGGSDGLQFTRSEIRARSAMSFGHYELLSRLRVGGMAEVFRARDLDDGDRMVAIKRILPSFTDEADYVAMFIDEARLGLRLRHPHIVKALELGQVDDVHFIALELIEGQDGAALIRMAREQSEPVPVAIACKIALEVCEALQYAHELRDENGAPLGLVHRDVSPQNILCSYDGQVKLIDFGIAKSSEQLMRTQAGLLKGKHGYLSPEQAMGHDVDRRTDVFSLGICLYEMLSARRLFQGSSDFSTIVRVRNGEIPPLRSLNGQVPDELAAIVHRALERDRNARYQSADAMREALLRFVEGSGESCSDAQLAAYLQERFGEGEPAAQEASERGPEPGGATGLLDAFDDLQPPSALSVISNLPPEEEIPTDPPMAGAALEEEGDLLEDAESYDELGEPEGDDDDLEGDRSPTQVVAAVAAVRGEGGFDDPDEALPAPIDQPTRVVAYESTDSGEVAAGDEQDAGQTITANAPVAPVAELAAAGEDEAAAAAAGEAAPAASSPGAPPAATLPGLGMEWDDEELSTQIYDPPSYSAEAAGVGGAARGDATPAGRRSSMRGSLAPMPVAVPLPFASTPSISPPGGASTPARVSLPPPGAASTPGVAGRQSIPTPSGRHSAPPPSGGAPSPFASLPPQGSSALPIGGAYRAPAAHLRTEAGGYLTQGPSRRALLLATLAAVCVVALVFAGLSIFAKPAKGTIHVATDPPDARVTLDGAPAPGSTSPFILTEVEPDVSHEIAVEAPGFRTWRTRLTVRPGKVEELPRVQLMREPGSEPKALPAAAAIGQQAAPSGPSGPSAGAAPSVQKRESGGGGAVIKRKSQPPSVPSQAPRVASGGGHGPKPVAQPLPAAGTGTLRINSRPWSRVLVDGRPAGNTPLMQLVLTPGWHTITLSNPDFGLKKVITVRIKAGEITTKIVDLQ